MDPREKKEMAGIVGEAIDQKVVPRLAKLETMIPKVDKIGESVEFIREQVAENSIDITEMKEDLSDSKFTIERIETRLHTVVKDQDSMDLKTKQMNRRVLRLESKKAS